MKIVKILFFALIIIQTSGCVYWREGDVQPIKDFPQKQLDVSIKLRYEINFKANGMSVLGLNTENERKSRETIVIEKFNNTNLFKEVASDSKNPDYYLTIKYDSNDINFWNVLSCYTLGIIPGFGYTDYTITAELENNNKLINRYGASEELHTATEILLLLAIPFTSNGGFSQIGEIYDELIDNIIYQTYQSIMEHNKLATIEIK